MADEALAPDPEAARASFEKVKATLEQQEVDAAAKEKADKAKADRAELRARLKQDRVDRAESAASVAGKEAEAAAKEASVAAGDPRDSVFDVAPGKSVEDVVIRNAELAAGKHRDIPAEPLPPQFFVVSDELTLIEVAAKLGLHDHSALGALNGRYSSNYGVQRGERVVLPAEYRFDGIDGVVTAGDEATVLAGTEPTA